jgi:hypothetical protein
MRSPYSLHFCGWAGRERIILLFDFSSSMPSSLLALLITLGSTLRSRLDLQLEILALRHLGVLKRSVHKRPRLRSTDRLLWSRSPASGAIGVRRCSSSSRKRLWPGIARASAYFGVRPVDFTAHMGQAQETQVRGYWVDPSTGLMWAGRDNGKDVNWHKAMKYCRDLRLAGYSDCLVPSSRVPGTASAHDPQSP